MSTNRRRPSATLTKILSSTTEEDRRHTRERMLIAIKIMDALEVKGLSQKAFAELMGKSESEISEWLSGNRNFTIDTLSDIGTCLGISLLPNSDMRTKIIPNRVSSIKVVKTRTSHPYILLDDILSVNEIGEWCDINNSCFALA